VVLDPAAVIVQPDVAARQVDEERAAAGGPSSDPGQPGKVETGREPERGGAADTTPRPPAAPKRFYGRVSLEPVRMLRDLGDIADAVVGQLGRADAEVTITVEIEAIAEGGFSDDVRRTVSENARTLKFDAHEFEE
jgi:hypothetical protein